MQASPFQLKMQALADYAETPWRRFPDEGSALQAVRAFLRVKLESARGSVRRFPNFLKNMDEYPSVPFYRFRGDVFYYDSSGLALHLDTLKLPPLSLVPEDPALRFLCRLIDEAFDEFGLYLVHHQRWVTSARTNRMAEMTAAEMRKLVPPPFRASLRRWLGTRQARRCPYLFSVAPPGFECGVKPDRTPPSRDGFPATHQLLNTAWHRYLDAMEHLLSEQAYLLGARFTLADASAYGQLGMNLVDGKAAEILREKAPHTFRWLCAIRDEEHLGSAGQLDMGEALAPLLDCIAATFVPLMQQNEEAYARFVAQGQHRFNQAAFDRGEALYDGELMGEPFRSVVKTFQVATWRERKADWKALDTATMQRLRDHYPRFAFSAFER